MSPVLHKSSLTCTVSGKGILSSEVGPGRGVEAAEAARAVHCLAAGSGAMGWGVGSPPTGVSEDSPLVGTTEIFSASAEAISYAGAAEVGSASACPWIQREQGVMKSRIICRTGRDGLSSRSLA